MIGAGRVLGSSTISKGTLVTLFWFIVDIVKLCVSQLIDDEKVDILTAQTICSWGWLYTASAVTEDKFSNEMV